jgi:hypothetical protein
MTRPVELLPLTIALAVVLSPGCVTSDTDKGPLIPDWPRPVDPPPKTASAGARPALPPDWSIVESGRADGGIRQVTYPEKTREQEGAARSAAAPAKAATKPPEDLPRFEIPAKTEEPLVAALRCFLDRRPAEADDYLKGCDKANREALLCLLPVAARLRAGSLDSARPQDVAELLDGVHGLEAALRRRAPLQIERMCFCRWMKDFGHYEPLADGQAAFEAGSNGQLGGLVQVYAEVRNFASATDGPVQVTRLISWGEIRDYAHGQTVAKIDFDNKVDQSRSPRQDFYINYYFRVPASLPPGPYTLWIYVKDGCAQPSRPPARRSLDFRVVAGGSAHGSRGEPGLAAR